jgi:Tfp pilus assembly protein PilF
MAANSEPVVAETRIDSWKAIAAFFARDERTVKRWEKERGMPVHRVPGSVRGTVFAYPAELSRWLQGESEIAAGDPAPPAATPSIPPTLPSPEVFTGQTPPTRVRGARWQPVVWVLPLLLIAGILIGSFGRHVAGFKRALAATNQPDPASQELYLKGRYYFEKRTQADLDRAVDFFTQAIVRDPQYAQAYVGLADCYHLLREFSAMPTAEAEVRAFAAAKKATELDPNSAAAHNSLAFASFWGYVDVAGADREFQRAIALDPNFSRAHHWYATFLIEIGRSQQALAEIERARQLDPSSKAILADKGFILVGAGRTEEARALLRQMEASDPDFASVHHYLALIDWIQGNYQGWLEEKRTEAALTQDSSLEKETAAQQAAYDSGGVRGLHEYQLAAARKAYETGHGSPYFLAQAYAGELDRKQALKYLHLAQQQHDPWLAILNFDPAFQTLHVDPQFREIVAQVGLPPVQ